MEKRESTEHTLSNIPEIIEPGVTIPIYEEDVTSNNSSNNSQTDPAHHHGGRPPQAQKLGSYRARAGKFSNTLSNLLPSISAKLHSSKKIVNGKNSNVVLGGGIGDMSKQDLSTKDRKVVVPVVEGIPADLAAGSSAAIAPGMNDPQNMETLINFPDYTNYLLNAPRTSGDSYDLNGMMPMRVSRTRNDTISSQITSMSSSIMPKASSTSAIWSSNQPSADPSQHYMSQQYNSMANRNTSPLKIYPTSQPYYEPAATNSNNGANLSVPNNVSVWSQPGTAGSVSANTAAIATPGNNRQRSRSNASSVYIDAQNYDMVSRQKASSIYSTKQNYDVPLVGDDVDPSSLNWVTTDPTAPQINQISTLLPTNTITVTNVFSLQRQQPHLSNAIDLTSTSLATLCLKYGHVVSARTLKDLNMAIIEFDSTESAVLAMEGLQGKEVSVIGAPSNVAFAKVLPMNHQASVPLASPGYNGSALNDKMSQPLLHEQLYSGAVSFQQQGNVTIPVFNQEHSQQGSHLQSNFSNSTIHIASNDKEQCPFALPPPDFSSQVNKLKEIIKSFGVKYDELQINYIILNAQNHKGTTDTTNFGPLPTPSVSKAFDAPKLREIRKGLDAEAFTSLEIEELAVAMLDELPELSSDYLGNTIVQKLYERSSDIIKDIILRRTSRYLASMGVHKNGTWACQKMITKSTTPRQKQLVAEGVRDFCTPLFNDQFGNYVIQCVLKYGFSWNNFIFDSILANFWIIVQNRYGARAVRACLEAHDIVTEEQTLVLSSMIVLYAEYMTTNSNATLLVTWLLDTCVLPDRHFILASKLISHIVELCCHRLASLTISKILNYRGDDRARTLILNTIFGDLSSTEPPVSLREILCNTTHGPTFVYKVLSMPLLEGDIRAHVIKQVRAVLLDSTPVQYHRRLMEEVGLEHTSGSHGSHPQHHNSASVFSSDSPSHIRQISVSSAKSNGTAKYNTMNSAAATATATAQKHMSSGALSTNSNYNSLGYLSYPGIFPSGYVGANNGPVPGSAPNGTYNAPFVNNNFAGNTNDLLAQLEAMSLNDGSRLSLPKLSITNANGDVLPSGISSDANGQDGVAAAPITNDNNTINDFSAYG